MRTYLDIFRLKFERRMTDRQIALTLNIGRSTVNNILTRFRSLQVEWPLPEQVSLEQLDRILMPGRYYKSQRVLPSWLKVHTELSNSLVTMPISVYPDSYSGIIRTSVPESSGQVNFRLA